MNKQYKEIEDLVNRFFEGETSNREEQQLYAFFKGEDIPEQLQSYKEVFTYFEEGIRQESTNGIYQTDLLTVKKKPRRRIITIMTVAASILALTLIKPVFFDNKFNPYEGSYIMKNGEKTYNIDEIKAKEKEIEKQMAQIEMEMESLYNSADDKMEELSEIENQFDNK